jgi:hypothetical protein
VHERVHLDADELTRRRASTKKKETSMKKIACVLSLIVVGAASQAGAQLAGVEVDPDKPLIEARFDELADGLRMRIAPEALPGTLEVDAEIEWQPPAYDD